MTSSSLGLVSHEVMSLRFQTIGRNDTLACPTYCDCSPALCCCFLSETWIHSCSVPARPGSRSSEVFATVAPAGPTLNIQQRGGVAPERSSNYRRSQPDSLYLHLSAHRSGLSQYFMSACAWVRGVNENLWETERERELKLSICVPICLPLHVLYPWRI